MKQTIELNVPNGYEVAEGEQPRSPIKGEYRWLLSWDKPVFIKNDWLHSDYDKYIILKKKAPKYEARTLHAEIGKPVHYVEKKALEDAIALLRSETATDRFKYDKKETYEALEELIK